MRLVLSITHLLRVLIEDLYIQRMSIRQLARQAYRESKLELTSSISSNPSGGFLVLVVLILGMLVVGDDAESTK